MSETTIRLYEATTTVPEFAGYKEVRLEWCAGVRNKPAVNYADVIDGYPTGEGDEYTEAYIDELLTEAELEELKAYLGRVHGWDVQAKLASLPLPSGHGGCPLGLALEAGSQPWDVYDLAHEPGYDLSVPIEGYAPLGDCMPLEGIFLRAESHNMSASFPCALCGEFHEQANAAIYLYVDGEHVGDVCPICAHLGPRGAARRMRDHAVALLDQARGLLKFGDQVEAMRGRAEEWTWSGLGALVRQELEVEAAIQDIPEAEREGWIMARLDDDVALRELWVKWQLETDPERRQELGALHWRASDDPSMLTKKAAPAATAAPSVPF